MRDAGWSDRIERLSLGPDVPPVILLVPLVPAVCKRDQAAVSKLIGHKRRGLDVGELIWDRGYSQLRR